MAPPIGGQKIVEDFLEEPKFRTDLGHARPTLLGGTKEKDGQAYDALETFAREAGGEALRKVGEEDAYRKNLVEAQYGKSKKPGSPDGKGGSPKAQDAAGRANSPVRRRGGGKSPQAGEGGGDEDEEPDSPTSPERRRSQRGSQDGSMTPGERRGSIFGMDGLDDDSVKRTNKRASGNYMEKPDSSQAARGRRKYVEDTFVPGLGALKDAKKKEAAMKAEEQQVVDRRRQTVSHTYDFAEKCDRVMESAMLKTAKVIANPKSLFEDEEGKAGANDGAQGEDGGMFGFPSFSDSNFVLSPPEETTWVDDNMPKKLHLHLAVHRRNSCQRYCLVVEKADLPGGVTPQKAVFELNKIRKIDHVNVLQLLDVYEDEDSLYLMYEHFDCVTLASCLQSHKWTQEEIVNIARELCAASDNATNTCQVFHLGWTLYHVLLPVTGRSRLGKPIFTKVFGFGLLGLCQTDSVDHLLWGPECMRRFYMPTSAGQHFLAKVEGPTRQGSDAWSVGSVIYSVIARRPPCRTDADVQAKVWSHDHHVEDFDPEAKPFLEAFLEQDVGKRVGMKAALELQWIKRRWKPLEGANETFEKMERHCKFSKTKTAMGKFLCQFLQSRHRHEIAHYFYTLDRAGNGVIMLAELEGAAKIAGRTVAEGRAIYLEICTAGRASLSFADFLQVYAEDTIEGGALRNAYETLDENASGCITARELYKELVKYEESLSLSDVFRYIDRTETVVVDDNDVPDHKLQYEEFCDLFPANVAEEANAEARMTSMREAFAFNVKNFSSNSIQHWVNKLERLRNELDRLCVKCLQSEHRTSAPNAMHRHFEKIELVMACPSGPIKKKDLHSMQKKWYKAVTYNSQMARDGKAMGFDSFLQDKSQVGLWADLIEQELKALHKALHDKHVGVNSYAAKAIGDRMCQELEEIEKWAVEQMHEYEAIVELMGNPELAPLQPHPSRRGLRQDPEEHEDAGFGMGGGGSKGGFHLSSAAVLAWFTDCTGIVLFGGDDDPDE